MANEESIKDAIQPSPIKQEMYSWTAEQWSEYIGIKIYFGCSDPQLFENGLQAIKVDVGQYASCVLCAKNSESESQKG